MKQLVIGTAALLIIGVVALGVLAYRGESGTGPNYDADVHAQLEAAMEAGDYEAWLAIREANDLPMRGKIFSVVNEENFATYVALHEANEAGDMAAAEQLRAELGLGQGKRQGTAVGGAMAGKQGQGCGGACVQDAHGTGACHGFVDSDGDGLCDRSTA